MNNNKEQMPTCSIEDRIAVLTLNDPKHFNPIDEQVARTLLEYVGELGARDDIDALIITGAGKAFSGGGNIDVFKKGLDDQDKFGDYIEQTMMRGLSTPLAIALHDFPKPVICAVNGIAAGVGFSLALACDIVLAAKSASFISPFMANLGLIPDMGMTWYLPRLIGRPRATVMSLLGERISAQQAVDWGMIWACVDDDQLMSESADLGRRLARIPSHAISEMRAALGASESNTLIEQLEYETLRQRELVRKSEFREGVEAFSEKRAPKFR